MAEPDREGLNQQDLSQLSLRQMSPIERAELQRRYTEFVRHFGKRAAPPPPEAPKPVRKWVPGERRG